MSPADWRTWVILGGASLTGSLLPLGTASGLQFQEVAEQAGVDFRHAADKTQEKHLVEAMGSGVAALDYDGDGLLDLYFVNGSELAGDAPKADPRYWNRLYRNLGEWRFEDVTEQSGAAGRGYGMGAAVADYDADGDPDLLVTNFGPDLLLRNEGDGTFRDVSREAGIEGNGWSSGAAFLDFNNDGNLDLFVAGYLDWDLARSRPCGALPPPRNSYCHPRVFGPARHTLYRNLGRGSFENVSTKAAISEHPGKGLGVALGDFDRDGWVDIFVANDSYPQQLFRNVRGERFEEVAVAVGVAFDAEGRDYAGMGVSWADFDRDMQPDLLVNALGRQGYWLYRNAGGRFHPVSEKTGLAALSALRSGWGMGLEDFDNDGWRDLLVAQGHVMDDIEDSDPALAHGEPLLLARNLFGRFYDAAEQAGPAFQQRQPGRGIAFGDFDNDGKLDAAVSVNNGRSLLLRNVSSGGTGLTVRLQGTGGNTDAVGAEVRALTSTGIEQVGFRTGAGSYLSASSPDLHFGLGLASHWKSITVRWPDGAAQTVAEPSGSLLVIRRDGRARSNTR